MSFPFLCTAAGVLSLVFGLSFLLAPVQTLATYGRVDVDISALMLARYFGAALLMAAAALVGLREFGDAGPRRRLPIGLAAASAVGLGVALYDVASGQINALGWSSVVVYAVFTVGFARLGMGYARPGQTMSKARRPWMR